MICMCLIADTSATRQLFTTQRYLVGVRLEIYFTKKVILEEDVKRPLSSVSARLLGLVG